MARAPPTFPQPTNAMGLRRHSTKVWSMAFLSTAGYPWLYSPTNTTNPSASSSLRPSRATSSLGFAQCVGRWCLVEERQWVVPQVKQPDVKAAVCREVFDHPHRDALTEPSRPRGSHDDLDLCHCLSLH